MRNKDHFSALELQNMGALWLDIWINWCLSWLDLDHNLLVFLTNSTAVSFDKPETPDNQFVPLQPNTDFFHLAQAHHRIPPLCCSQAWISVGKKKKKRCHWSYEKENYFEVWNYTRITGLQWLDNSIAVFAPVCSTPTSFLHVVYLLKIEFWWQPIAPLLGCHYLKRWISLNTFSLVFGWC